MTHLVVCDLRWCRLALGTCTYAVEPKVLKWLTEGVQPCQDSKGVWWGRAEVGEELWTSTNVIVASPQNVRGRCASCSMAMIPSSSVWLKHSATPFCWGVTGVVLCLKIPEDAVNASNSLEVYSPPLSSCSVLMVLPVWFSTNALYCLNVSSAFSQSGYPTKSKSLSFWSKPEIQGQNIELVWYIS